MVRQSVSVFRKQSSKAKEMQNYHCFKPKELVAVIDAKLETIQELRREGAKLEKVHAKAKVAIASALNSLAGAAEQVGLAKAHAGTEAIGDQAWQAQLEYFSKQPPASEGAAPGLFEAVTLAHKALSEIAVELAKTPRGAKKAAAEAPKPKRKRKASPAKGGEPQTDDDMPEATTVSAMPDHDI